MMNCTCQPSAKSFATRLRRPEKRFHRCRLWHYPSTLIQLKILTGIVVMTLILSNEGTKAALTESGPHAGQETWPVIEPTIADLPYADRSPAEKLDLYLPARTNAPAPLVIWIHGGGFRVGDKRSMPRRTFGPPPVPAGPNGPYQIQVPSVTALVAKGYAVVSLNYSLGTSFAQAALPAIQDGKAAVRFLRANAGKYNLDPNRFAVWGNSAGGYMAAVLGVTGDQSTIFDDPKLGNADISSAVQAVVVWYGAEDRLAPDLQPATYLASAKVLPPFRIVNGDADPVISVAQAQRLCNGLKKAGAKATLTILPGAGHEDPAYMATQMPPTFAFLDAALGR